MAPETTSAKRAAGPIWIRFVFWGRRYQPITTGVHAGTYWIGYPTTPALNSNPSMKRTKLLSVEPVERNWKPQWQATLNQFNLFSGPPKLTPR